MLDPFEVEAPPYGEEEEPDRPTPAEEADEDDWLIGYGEGER